MALHIVGAGMAGLLAANLLRRQNPVVFEAQSSLPDNHGALLRFRSDIVSRRTGIPFRPVTVHKAVKTASGLRTYATLRDHNEYSLKVTGRILPRSILSLESVQRWIAPPDFIERLAEGVREIYMGHSYTYGGEAEPTISTIPMPTLMNIKGGGITLNFQHKEVWSSSIVIPRKEVDVFQTIYYPQPCDEEYYRASITGNRLTIEYAGWPPDLPLKAHLYDVLSDFGLGEYVGPDDFPDPDVKYHKFGKLLPLDDDFGRRAFIVAMTDRYNIYSVGRFATWRQILLDDVVHDVDMVARFIEERSAYGRRLQQHT